MKHMDATVPRQLPPPASDSDASVLDESILNSRAIRIAILADFPLAALDNGALGRGGGQGCTWLPQLALAFEGIPDLEVHWLVLKRTRRAGYTRRAHGQYFHAVRGVPFSLDVALRYHPARFAIRRKLAEIKPDLVHAWGTERIYPAALQDCRAPTILSMQGVLTEYQKIGGLGDSWIWRRMVSSDPLVFESVRLDCRH